MTVTIRPAKIEDAHVIAEAEREIAKDTGILEKIQLNVRASNLSAISFYQKMGFREEGRVKNRVKIKDRYIDDIIMGLDLRDEYEARLEVHDAAIREMQERDIDSLIKAFCFSWKITCDNKMVINII